LLERRQIVHLGRHIGLEKSRLNHAYQHKDDSESQITLRSDIRIRQFEDASKSNEPKRIEHAQMLKAVGTSSGKEQLCASGFEHYHSLVSFHHR
jgi:hypothetical protein